MSLITRCPACATMFKVVPDQLRISAGWVRCGVCGEVFDAAAQMLLAAESKELESAVSASIPVMPVPPAEPLVELPEAPGQETSSALGSDGMAEQELPVVDVTVEVPLDSATESPPSPPMSGNGGSVQGADQAPPRADALFARPANVGTPAPVAGPGSERAAFSLRDNSAPVPAVVISAAVPDSESWIDAIAKDASAEDEALEPLEPSEEVPSFVRQAQRKAFWRSRGVRVAVWLAVLLLALGLGWQWAVQQRDWLAAREPRLVPMLELLCRPGGCAIAPYRDLNAIVIDGSSFQRVSGNSFQLSFGLRNNGKLPVATPSLELTLTDAQDQALLRRVLKVQDLSAPPTLSAQGEFNGTSALSVDVPDPAAIVGYRLMAFYP